MVMKSLSAPLRIAAGSLACVAVLGLVVSAQQTTDPQAPVNSAEAGLALSVTLC